MQHIEVRTPYTSLNDAARSLARSVNRDSVSVVSEKPVAEGEWVSFRFSFEDGSPILEGQGLCCEMQRVESGGSVRYRVTIAALQLEAEHRARHRILFEERMKTISQEVVLTSDVPTVRVVRPTGTTPGVVEEEGTGTRPKRTTGVMTKGARGELTETCVQEVMLLPVNAELLDHAGEILEKITRMQGTLLAKPTSMHALLEHAMQIGLTVLDTQMNTFVRSA